MHTHQKHLWSKTVPTLLENNIKTVKLKQKDLIQSVSDPCISTDVGGDMYVFIGIYADDIILAGCSDKRIQEVKDVLAVKFNIKDNTKLHYFLGIKSKSIWIN